MSYRLSILIVLIPLVLGWGCNNQMQCQKEGFQKILNGKDLSGWQISGKAKWLVKNGQLIGTQGENYAHGDLFTDANYDDFLLKVTYRVEWPCNTGIWFRYQSDKQAYQADILEYKNPECYSGTLYCPGKLFLAMNTNKEIVNREGWNTMTIRAEGDHLQIWINKHKVADVRDKSSRTGKIGFQIHQGEQFGSMKIVVREALLKPLGSFK